MQCRQSDENDWPEALRWRNGKALRKERGEVVVVVVVARVAVRERGGEEEGVVGLSSF